MPTKMVGGCVPSEEASVIEDAGLNPPQLAAVMHDSGPLVVFAGAGSGKTRVITYRIARLLETGVPLDRIMAVTFTNKAAGEMRERLSSLIGRSTRGLWVGTFHSTCARILRGFHEVTGVRRDFTIYDDQDQQAMVKRVMNDLKLDLKRHPPRTIQNRINKAKQEVLGPDDVDTDEPSDEIVQRVYALYEERMAKAGALDFGDLIYRLVVALERNDGFRKKLSSRFEYLLVDEFQDTNHAQFRLVRALASEHRNLCVVGDDDQCIYRWRGADRRNILDFKNAFNEAQIIKLEQNYRSTQRVLRCAYSIIRRNKDREPKELWTDNPDGQKILIVETDDERDEARMIVRAVAELQDEGNSLEDMVVFYRIHAQSRVLEEALRTENVPYHIVGGTRFYDRAEIKDAIAYLRVVHNPDDDVSLLRIINTPARGIGKSSIQKILNDAATTGKGVFDAVTRATKGDLLSSGPRKKMKAFHTLMTGFMDASNTMPLEELGAKILEETGYLELLKRRDDPESDARLQNLQELLGSMQLFVSENDGAGLAEFLENVTLDSEVSKEEAVEERLTLMTVHAAKGLEFPTVFVAGMEERLFPFKGTDLWDDPEELEEERRLAYVAITRAEQRLILSYTRMRRIFGQLKVSTPSRFVEELPREDVEMLGAAPRKPRPKRFRPRPMQQDPFDFPEHAQDRDHALDVSTTESRVVADPFESSSAEFDGDSYIDRSEGDFSSGVLEPGMRVRHAKFGIGEVRSLSEGSPPRVTVRFKTYGDKKIMASYLRPA